MKRILATVLCLVMLLSLIVGCGAPKESGQAQATTAAATTAAEKPKEQPKSITVVFVGETPKDHKMVNDELNKYTLDKINVEAVLKPIETANYVQQVNLMITSREKMDLLMNHPLGAVSYSIMSSQKQLMDITDLAPKYAQPVIDAIKSINPSYLEGTYIDGRLYGFTSLFDKASGQYIAFPKDLLDKHKLDITKVKNINDLEAILDVLKKNEPQSPWFAPMIGLSVAVNFDDFSKPIMQDTLGDNNFRYGVVLGDDNTKVQNMYATDYYKKWLEIARRWYLKGYQYKDYPTTLDRVYTFVISKAVLGVFDAGEADWIYTIDGRCQRDMEPINIGQGVVTTSNIQKFTWSLPTHCSDPEAALKYLSIMYTDEYYQNTLNYGIKDKHWVEKPDGTAAYPDGITSTTATYKTYGSFIFGNQFLVKPMAPAPGDLRKKAAEINKNAKASQLMGFTVNNSSLQNELTAITNVLEEYRKGLECGASDPAKVYPQFLKALDDAGMQKVITEVQKQIDAFLANKK